MIVMMMMMMMMMMIVMMMITKITMSKVIGIFLTTIGMPVERKKKKGRVGEVGVVNLPFSSCDHRTKSAAFKVD